MLGAKSRSKAFETGLTVAGSTSTLTLPSSCPKALLPFAECSQAACHLEATKSGTCQYSAQQALRHAWTAGSNSNYCQSRPYVLQ